MGIAGVSIVLFGLILGPVFFLATAAGAGTGLVMGVIGPRMFLTLREEMLRQGFSHQTGRRNLVPTLLGVGPAFAALAVALQEMLVGNSPVLSALLFLGALSHLSFITCIQGQRISRELECLTLQTSRSISMTWSVGGPLFRFESPNN